MFIRVFGCPVQFQPLDKPRSKMAERTVDGYFVGVHSPSVLVQRVSDGKVLRVSPKKVRTHEATYCKTPCDNSEVRRDWVVGEEGGGEIPVSVPSVKALRPGSLYDSTCDQGREMRKVKVKGNKRDRPKLARKE